MTHNLRIIINELDWFVKSKLQAKHYIRYVDDFVIFEDDKGKLEFYKKEINEFLKESLKIELHPGKSKIFCLSNSLNFLGFKIFYYYKLLKKSNILKMKYKYNKLKEQYSNSNTTYDKIYNFLEGWIAYAKHANTYKLRKILIKNVEESFPNEISTKDINRCLTKRNESF